MLVNLRGSTAQLFLLKKYLSWPYRAVLKVPVGIH